MEKKIRLRSIEKLKKKRKLDKMFFKDGEAMGER